MTSKIYENSARVESILTSLRAAVDGGAGDDWDHPAAATAVRLTGEAGMSWDFVDWADALECAESGMLGGVRLSGLIDAKKSGVVDWRE